MEFTLNRLHRPGRVVTEAKCHLPRQSAPQIRRHDDLRNGSQTQRLFWIHDLLLIALGEGRLFRFDHCIDDDYRFLFRFLLRHTAGDSRLRF